MTDKKSAASTGTWGKRSGQTTLGSPRKGGSDSRSSGGELGEPNPDRSRRKSLRGLFTRNSKKKTRTIVCIENDSAVLNELAKLCEELGCMAQCFSSATEAEVYLKESALPTDLVVASMMMPGLSGMQLLQQVRASEDESLRNTPFVLLSSFSKGNSKLQDFQIKTPDGSVVDILIKPLAAPVALKKFRSVMEAGSSTSPGVRRKEMDRIRSPASTRKDYSNASLENSRKFRSQQDLSSPLNDRLPSVSFGDADRLHSLSAAASPNLQKRSSSAHGSPLGDQLKTRRAAGHVRHKSETSSTPFLDTVFSGDVAPKHSERDGSTGPNWDELGGPDEKDASSSHSSIKHVGRRRTLGSTKIARK